MLVKQTHFKNKRITIMKNISNCEVILKVINPNTSLKFSYNLALTAYIYNAANHCDFEYSKSLHDSNEPKMFTFSNLYNFKSINSDYLLIDNYLKFKISGDSKIVLDVCAATFIKSNILNVEVIANNVLELNNNSRIGTYKTLSPIFLKKNSVLLDPTDKNYSKQLEENLKRKGANDPKIEIVKHLKSKSIKLKNNYIKCNEFLLNMNEDAALFSSYGLGTKNSLGFGYVEKLKYDIS